MHTSQDQNASYNSGYLIQIWTMTTTMEQIDTKVYDERWYRIENETQMQQIDATTKSGN